MAYCKEMPVCAECGKPAKVEVLSNRNASYGYWCKTHGKKRAAELTKQEQAEQGGAK